MAVDARTLVEIWRLPTVGCWLHHDRPVFAGQFLLDGLYLDDHPLVLVSSSGAETWRGLRRDADMRPVHVWRERLVQWTATDGILLVDPFDVGNAPRFSLPPGVVCGDTLIASESFIDGAVDSNEASVGFDLREERTTWQRPVNWRGEAGLLGPIDWTDELFLARDEKTLAMFSKEDGSELWRRRCFTGGRVRSTGRRAIALARRLDDSALGLSEQRYLMAFDSRSGESIYERQLEAPEEDFAPAWTSYPAVGREHVVFAARSGLIGAFRMSDGELAWSYKYKAELFEPCIVGNSIAVASGDGNLLMFDEVLPAL